MKTKNAEPELVQRRAELMVELFLQDLHTGAFVAQPDDKNFGYDFFVSFRNNRGGRNTYAVQLKATDRPVPMAYSVPRMMFDRMVNSNIPVLFLVADVKRNKLYYALPDSEGVAKRSRDSVSIHVMQIDDAETAQLRRRLLSANLPKIAAS